MSSELLSLLDRRAQLQAQEDLLAFTIYTCKHYEPSWHHRRLCERLDAFTRGEVKRLMVFMPPRHGKSELVSRRLPAYLLGKNPDASIIATSYSAGLANRMNRDAQRIMESKEFRRLFPDNYLGQPGPWIRNATEFEVPHGRGSYRASGVGGGITGMGADFGIIDDPIKNQEDAYSKVYRDKVWDWYISTFYTRLEGAGAGILLTLTRWHEDDLAGRLLKLAAEDPTADQWEVVNFPAIAEGELHESDPRETGEALWPEKFPVEYMEKFKAMGTYFWNALYQQKPSPPEGGLIKRDWWEYYDEIPTGARDFLQSWDLTFKDTRKGSFVVGQTWCRDGANRYLVDQFRGRTDFPGTIRAIRDMVAKYPQCGPILIEDKANGPAVIATLKKEIPGIIPVSVRGSKEARLHSVSPDIEAGNVYLPKKRWVDELVEELASFPNSTFDDQVDALSQALSRYKTRRTGKMELNMGVGLKTQRDPWR